MNLSESNRRKAALAVAMTADFLQVSLFPMFGEGFLSPFNDVLDVVVCGVLCALIGWHYSFIPALVAESVPGLNMVPTWTAAVLLATKSQGEPAPRPEVIIDA